MPNTGEEFALEVENKHLREAIKELGRNLGEISSKQAFAQNMIRALKNPDMLWKGAPLTLDRVQVMENGDIKDLPPPPEMTCTEEVTKDFGKRNGKKTESAVAELVEVGSDPA
jgi:hypothetical protein